MVLTLFSLEANKHLLAFRRVGCLFPWDSKAVIKTISNLLFRTMLPKMLETHEEKEALAGLGQGHRGFSKSQKKRENSNSVAHGSTAVI